jgi:hypothetical protein
MTLQDYNLLAESQILGLQLSTALRHARNAERSSDKAVLMDWQATSFQMLTAMISARMEFLVGTGRLVKYARYYWLLLAESHLTRRLFGAMIRRIELLPLPGS